MKQPSLSDFGLTEDQVAAALKLENRGDCLGAALFFGSFPILIIFCGFLLYAFGVGLDNGGADAVIYPIFIIFVVWVIIFLRSRLVREYSPVLKKRAEFIKAVEVYEKQRWHRPSGFTGQAQVEPPQQPHQQVSPLKSSSNELSLVGRSVVQPHVQESQSKPDSADSPPPADPPYIPPAGWNPTPVTPFLHEGLRLGTEKLLSGETQADAGSIIPSKTSKPRKARNPRPKKEPAIKEDFLPEHFSEGTARQITLTRYERDPRARRACLDHHGFSCNVCGTNLEEKYGELGEGVIQVHHLRPLSTIAENHEINPIIDLIPVCPDCHVILHRKTPPLTPDEVRQLLINQGRLKTPSETSAIKKRKPQPAKATVIKQPRAVSIKKPKGQFPEKLAVEQLKPEATMSYEERVPTDRLPKMTEAVKSLIAAGVTSPELVANTLDKLNPRSRKFSDHFWELFCEVDPSLCRSVDWQAIYQAKDAKARYHQA